MFKINLFNKISKTGWQHKELSHYLKHNPRTAEDSQSVSLTKKNVQLSPEEKEKEALQHKNKMEINGVQPPSCSVKQCIIDGALCFRRPVFIWVTISTSIFQYVIMGVAGTLPSWGVAKGFDVSIFFYVVAVVNA